MMHVPCEQCGTVMEIPAAYAGRKGRCQRCGHAFLVPEPEGEAPAGTVAPENFGAYSKVADELWDDPSSHVPAHEAPANLGTQHVPLDVLEKHRAQKRRQMVRIALLTLLILLVIGVVVALVLAAGSKRDAAPVPVDETTAPATATTATSRVADDGRSVYVSPGDTLYHSAQCVHGPAGNASRQRLSHEQALAAGYAPCKACQPLGHETYYHQPLYERIGEPVAATEPAAGGLSPPPVALFVNPGETEVHVAGCERLVPGRLVIAPADAEARGYSACPACLPE